MIIAVWAASTVIVGSIGVIAGVIYSRMPHWRARYVKAELARREALAKLSELRYPLALRIANEKRADAAAQRRHERMTKAAQRHGWTV